MIDKSTILQIIGCLMKHPQYLSETDKYNLTPTDFLSVFDRYIFVAIDNLYRDGTPKIQPIDVENFLNTNESGKALFHQQNGIEYLQDAIYMSDEDNFSYYYKKLKKFNLLTSLKKQGFDISKFYIEELTNPSAADVNKHFEDLEISDIIDGIRKSLIKIENEYVQNDVTEVINVFEGIEDLLENAETQADIGVPLQGDIFNEVCAGARKGIFVVRSAGSGVGKSRNQVADACYMSFPIRYDPNSEQWVQIGSCEKTLYIATEQTAPEIQRMILAYLTGFNETKFRYGGFTDKEKKIVQQALWILEKYQDNLYIVRMPNPTIELVKTIVRENVILHDIDNVFYDYIFICPSLINEFKGMPLRNDELLLMLSTALKDLAVELNVFMMTSTQLNAKGDDNTDIRNESAIAGSRAVINKADIGAIMARPTKEELEFLSKDGKPQYTPNLVTDIYKVRSGEWNQIRIWSDIDLGCLRKKDLFATDARMNVVSVGGDLKYTMHWDEETIALYQEALEYVNGM